MKQIEDIAIQLRALQLASQAAHHTVSGPEYLADHAHLGSLYEEYEEEFDKLCERFIRIGVITSETAINKAAAEISAEKFGKYGPTLWFDMLVEMDGELIDQIDEALNGEDAVCEEIGGVGNENLLQTLADSAESRLDKLIPRSQ